ncbi:MAG: peptide ABC transporter substrate-binding protein [Alphaproteobacteria bacterium]|nr:peptide ABC transporter substrate-binding protein [Alphaproteobacteria bacterium]
MLSALHGLAILACCLALGAQPAAAREQLVIALTQFPATFHPNINSMLAKSYVLALARRPITVHDKDWRLVCMLCTELPTIENGLARVETLPDGRQGVAITVKLDPDATWGDGVPATARDMVFTWEVGRHPESGFADAESFRRIRAIDVIDTKTMVIHVDRLTYDYSNVGGDILLPEHLERRVFEADPKEYRNRTIFDTDPTNPGLYNGPYRIVEVSAGAHIVLARNAHWKGRRPVFERIVVKTIENTAALEANLLSGAVDYVAGELGFSLDQALGIERRHPDRFTVLYQPGLTYEHIDLNLDNPILGDKRVRQALVLALDREGMVRELFAGKQPVAHGSVHPLDRIYSDRAPTYTYDLARAGELLAAAGWTRGPGGIRVNAQGKRLALTLQTTAGNRLRELVQQVLQSQWRKAGIEVAIRNEPARVFFGETMTRRTFPGLAMYAWLSAPESVSRTTQHSSMIPAAANGYSGQNYPGFADAETDRLIDTIEIELDPARRKELWHRLQVIYAEEVPVIPLYFRSTPFVVPKWLGGIEPTGHLVSTTTWIENWTVRP